MLNSLKNRQTITSGYEFTLFRHLQKISTFGLFTFIILISSIMTTPGQSAVNGGFEGRVTENGTPLQGVLVQFINQANGFQTAKKTDPNGYFRQTMLQPGVYTIKVLLDGYQSFEQNQELYATRSNSLIPVPIQLVKQTANPVPTPTPASTPGGGSNINLLENSISDTDQGGNLTPRRDSAFNERSVTKFPLGSKTLTRTFDELALLALGVAPPPQAIGNSVGPGVGGGVGTSGQFSVNGLRSRANNFLVDGADNNDEDIGVRRQGFFTLVPQPIESIQEFQIITLLAPAEFGRNMGGQVNALSKSGGNDYHGTVYGLFNSEGLNASNFFDNTAGNTVNGLEAINFNGDTVPVLLFDGNTVNQIQVANNSGDKDDFLLAQGGFALGGPIAKNKAFFFVSGEGQLQNATQERSFAVPTVEERGLFGSGADGLLTNGGDLVFPTSASGDLIFSYFPFANNPTGTFGRNTYTQNLAADAWGRIFSGKVDWNIFNINGNPQTFTARYNYTEDSRDLTDVGGALFSAIRPLVRTDNFSSYLTGSLSNDISNEFRFSWGRTRLRFEEIRDREFLLPVNRTFDNPEDARFLLNARYLLNLTRPNSPFPVYQFLGGDVETSQVTFVPGNPFSDNTLGTIGQLIVAGYSPVGVDVFNFPQERKNNTFQFADTLRWQSGNHLISFGSDIRRTYLESNLPRNSRPLVTFGGSVDISPGNICGSRFCTPADYVSAGAATGFFQSLVLPGNDSTIDLSYYQFNFFAQDVWRITPRLVLSYGLRYEYNTPPTEADNKIENALQFGAFPPELAGLASFIDGRTRIFEPDTNNFAPRVSLSYSPNNKTVIRAGYGLYYDQALGAVVSQSRNVFPTFSTVNFGGGLQYDLQGPTMAFPFNSFAYNIFNPMTGQFNGIPLIQPGTINTLNPNIDQANFISVVAGIFPSIGGNSFGSTIPQRDLKMPRSHQYSIGVEQEIFNNSFLSVAYVGTLGRDLLKFTTPNLGKNYSPGLSEILGGTGEPIVRGATISPFAPNLAIGPIERFESTGRSRYDSLQIGFRGSLQNKFQYRVNYVFSQVKDDVSDVFDLAGDFALPQNSLTPAGEYAVANFDVRHRFTYGFIYDLPALTNENSLIKFLFGDWSVSGTGKYNTGQPFTVNSIFDVNLDGNLTDRLDNTQFITITGDRQQPLILDQSIDPTTMLAAVGADGSIPRNSFRAGSILEMDLSFAKQFRTDELRSFVFRTDIFNFINRANFGIPGRILEAPGFGTAFDTVTPGRRIQFSLKFLF